MLTSRFYLPQRVILALLVVSGLCSKLLRIYQYRSLPLYRLFIYFPTFFILETLLFVAVWAVLHTTSGQYAVVAVIGTGLLA